MWRMVYHLILCSISLCLCKMLPSSLRSSRLKAEQPQTFLALTVGHEYSVAFSSVLWLPSEVPRWAKCFLKRTLCPGWGFASAEWSARAFSCLACDTCYLPILGWGLLLFVTLQHCWFQLNLWSAGALVSFSAECCLAVYFLCFVVRCSSLRVKYVVCPYWIASWLFQDYFPNLLRLFWYLILSSSILESIWSLSARVLLMWL